VGFLSKPSCLVAANSLNQETTSQDVETDEDQKMEREDQKCPAPTTAIAHDHAGAFPSSRGVGSGTNPTMVPIACSVGSCPYCSWQLGKSAFLVGTSRLQILRREPGCNMAAPSMIQVTFRRMKRTQVAAAHPIRLAFRDNQMSTQREALTAHWQLRFLGELRHRG